MARLLGTNHGQDDRQGTPDRLELWWNGCLVLCMSVILLERSYVPRRGVLLCPSFSKLLHLYADFEYPH